MKIYITIFTVFTLQLSKIQAREFEELNVEDQLLEVEADLDDFDLIEEDLKDDFNRMELKAKPSKRPFCIRTRRSGWGGECVGPNATDMVGLSCDFIRPDDFPNHSGEKVCRNENQVCCVDCDAKKQEENCRKNVGFPVMFARRVCCHGEHTLFPMDSGCNCCGKCKRTNFCRNNHGHCVYKYGVPSYQSCLEKGGRLKYKACGGKTCACCIPAGN